MVGDAANGDHGEAAVLDLADLADVHQIRAVENGNQKRV